MATVLAPSYQPRQGILLNRSPSVSPYRHSTSLPPLVPSNSSLSSSTSSISNLNTSDSDYTSSSTPASPHRGSRPLHPQKQLHHQPKPRAGSTPNSRRIRFAPLPDPRRELFITDADQPQLPSVFLDDSDSPKVGQNYVLSSAEQPNSLSLKDQETKLKAAPCSSLLFSSDPTVRSAASESTPTLASTATITPNPNPNTANATAGSSSHSSPSDLDGGEWNVLKTVSPRPSSLNLPEDPPSRTNSVKGKKWSRKLLKPLFAPLSKASRSTDDLRSSASTTSLSSTLTLPQSPGVEGCSVGLGSGAKSSDKEKPKKKKKREEPEWIREFGMPLYRWSSEGDPMGIPMNSQGRAMTMSELRDAGPEFWKKHHEERLRRRSGSGTRMLNGRVYGAKRMNGGNAFANIRSEEPEFVEWGFGGMGSVQKGGVGAGIWAKVQAGSGLSVGAHESENRHKQKTERSATRPSSAGRDRDDDDDGSGMSWVKRRKEQREKEQREKEARDREERKSVQVDAGSGGKQHKLAVADSPPGAEPHSSASDPDPPKEDGGNHAFREAFSSSPAAMSSPLPEVGTPSAEEKHLLTAVNLPPEYHHHHHRHGLGHSHSHSHSRSTIERLPSLVKGEPERRDSADTARNVPLMSDHVHAQAEVAQAPVNDVVKEDEGRHRTESTASGESAQSHGSSSSADNEVDDEGEADELESPKDDEGEEDEEDEFEDSERARFTVTALGAGVEKISRHRASTPLQDADAN